MSENFVNAIKTHVNKTKTPFAITLILLLTASTLLPVTLMANAQNTSNAQSIESHTYMSVAPNPIGVGQTLSIRFWLDNAPPQTNYVTYYGWNYTVTVTKPDGTNTTLGPFESDPNGGWGTVYVPDEIGTYQLQANFLGATVNVTGQVGLMTLSPGLYTFLPSHSRAQELTVQQQPIEPWPGNPTPTGSWSYPINAENQNWYSIAGNWLGTGFGLQEYNPYTTAPSTPHVLWTKPLDFGGIADGALGWGINYYTGLLYQNKFTPIIISGRLYYNLAQGAGGDGVACVDLQTGDVIWENNTMPPISCGQVFTFNTGTQAGAMAYLWSFTGTSFAQGGSGGWQVFDAFDGRLLTTLVDIPISLNLFGVSPNFGPNGEIILYFLNSQNHWMAMWNSTLALGPKATQFFAEQWSIWNTPTLPWSSGIQWNVTVPAVAGSPTLSFVDYADGVIVAEAMFNTSTTSPIFEHVGYSTVNGSMLWVQNRTNVGWGPGGPSSPGLIGYWAWAYGDGTYAYFQKETMQWHVININNGTQRFVTQPLNQYTNSDWSLYDWGVQMVNGVLYTDGYSGDVVAFNLTTGQHMWTFTQGSSGLETPYGTWPTFGGVTIADNKVYFGVTEHSPATPLYRGYALYCLDVATGQLIWKMPAFFTSMAVSGGILVGYNGYDNQIYAFGKGQTATTVTATAGVGNVVTLQGKVTDQSPGNTSWAIPAAGTPAVSDSSMDQWMAYLYAQHTKPTNTTGVQVTLTALDPNGNTEQIGITTSDMSGHYALLWNPPVPGLYTVTATFAGTNSYYSSSAETSISVSTTASSAPVVTPSPSSSSSGQASSASSPSSNPTATASVSTSPSPAVAPTEGQSSESYIVVSAVVIIALVAVVAVLLRRRRIR